MNGAARGIVALGSGNPAKRQAVQEALARLLGADAPAVTCMEVASGVASQPWGDGETRRGAANRAAAALRTGAAAGAALAVGLEGGVARHDGRLWAFSWAVAVRADGDEAASRSATFALPSRVADMVEAGMELGDAMDRVFGTHGSKREQGAVGLLTGGALSRAELYAQPALLALAPLLAPGPPAG